MADHPPELEGATGGRRSFLKKAAVAGGVVWVAPTVLSSVAGAQPGSGGIIIDIPFPPPPPGGMSMSPGPICGIGPVQAMLQVLQPGLVPPPTFPLDPPGTWEVFLQFPVPIEIVGLSLVGPGAGGGSITSPQVLPPDPVSGLCVGGQWTVDSFFDVFIRIEIPSCPD